MAEALRDAVLNSDLAQLRETLATGVDVDARLSQGCTALHYAAYLGRTACIEFLIDAGASVRSVDDQGCTALIIATTQGTAACVRALITAGADVNCASPTGRTPFSHALHRGHRCILKVLLRAGADLHTASVERWPHISSAWALVDTIRVAGGWPQYVHRRRETFASVVKKAVTRDALPDAINLEIATFMEPPGGYSPALY